MLTVVAYYTRGTPYEAEAKLLRASLEAVGMEHLVVGVPSRGDWDSNTARKPTLLRNWRRLLSGSLLYVDVDAFFHANCTDYFATLATGRWDFGLHYFRGPAFGHDRRKVQIEGWWPLTGTIFVGDTQGARDILARWCAHNAAQAAAGVTSGGGQKNLQELLPDLAERHRIARIPGRYCYVFDKPWAYPHAQRDGCCCKSEDHPIHQSVEPCIIEHTIASRENRDPTRRSMNLVRARRARIAELEELVA